MKDPFFTVVIPTYNREDLIQEAIRSVLNQTFGKFELIVVDDHSIDNTNDVVTSFGDDRITYIVNDHTKGGAGARNAGIFRAKGEWVAFLDDDDVWLPEKLELQYKKIKEVNDSVGLIYTGYAAYDFDNKREISLYMPENEGWLQEYLLYKNVIGTFSIVVIRSNLLRKIGGLDEEFESMQDMELYFRIASLSKIEFIKDKLTYVRHSNTDRITLNAQKRLKGSLSFWKKHEKVINKSSRLKHYTFSRIFLLALKQRNWKSMFKALPWTIAGIFFDPPHMFRVVWGVFLYFFCKHKFN